MTSCVNDDFNDNNKRPYVVPAETLLTNAEKELITQITTPSVNNNVIRFFVQYWTVTTYTDEPRFDLISRAIPDKYWENLYRKVLGNLETARNVIIKEVTPPGTTSDVWSKQQKNKLAIIDIIQVYTFQILVDTYGNVPYSEALDPNIILPKYDDAETIYNDLILRIDKAITDLDETGKTFAFGEMFYNGSIPKWKMLANSIKLKIGINLADHNPAKAKGIVEEAYNNGVITTNAENATFKYDAVAPNFNPIYENIVASGRNDFIPSSTIVDAMNMLEDPRRAIYFTKVNGIYKGGINGKTNTFSLFSHLGSDFHKADLKGILMEATEVNFYLAEAASRNYTVGDAKKHYENGIRTSFESWGIGAQADAYIATVPYNSGNWKALIGQQEWIALFNRQIEGWNMVRRLDTPQLNLPDGVSPSLGLNTFGYPQRMTYPINEDTVNGANKQDAIQAMGGKDGLNHKIFWDIN